MIDHSMYQQIQKLREIGLSKAKTSKNLGIPINQINYWWEKSDAEYWRLEQSQEYELDNYREFIISLLKVCPQMRNTNIRYKLEEAFPDFSTNHSTFGRYMKKLRDQTGYTSPFARQTSPRQDLPPGYEAQVDFGQYKMKDMYGKSVRVYFFVMVLSYSRMKFAFFSPDPFTTATAVQAHEMAFKYFGGRTQTIMYDQDRVFVVSENLGNIIFVKAFEEYIKQTGFSVVLCRPRDPQSKGKVEEVVGYIKGSFLEGRIYTGIDSLNSAFLTWLDRDGNGQVHLATKKTPREMFRQESKYLEKVYVGYERHTSVRTVNSANVLPYKDNRYAMPPEAGLANCRVRVEEQDGQLLIYHPTTNELVCKHELASDIGKTVMLKDAASPEYTSSRRARGVFAGSEKALKFIDMLKTRGRYADSQLRHLHHMSVYYPMEQLLQGIDYCLNARKNSVVELSAYLIYRYGDGTAKQYLSLHVLNNHKKRADEIREVLHGEHS